MLLASQGQGQVFAQNWDWERVHKHQALLQEQGQEPQGWAQEPRGWAQGTLDQTLERC